MENKIKIVIFLSIILSACTSSTGIVKDGKDAFRIMITGDTGFTNSGSLQKKAYRDASNHCSSKGKIMETIEMDSKQARPLGGWPEATLRFRCVKRDVAND